MLVVKMKNLACTYQLYRTGAQYSNLQLFWKNIEKVKVTLRDTLHRLAGRLLRSPDLEHMSPRTAVIYIRNYMGPTLYGICYFLSIANYPRNAKLKSRCFSISLRMILMYDFSEQLPLGIVFKNYMLQGMIPRM